MFSPKKKKQKDARRQEMKDINGNEIKTGMVVEIKNAYFKNDNGLYFVDASAGDPNWCSDEHCLHKLCKNGKISTARHTTAFWPLASFCSDPVKNANADEWNAKHATIEIKTDIPTDQVSAYFAKKAEDAATYVILGEETAKFYAEVAEAMSAGYNIIINKNDVAEN